MISALILSDNSDYELKHNLSLVHKFITAQNGQLIVLDNSPNKQSMAYVHSEFPDITYMPVDTELSITDAINDALSILRTPYLLLLSASISLYHIDATRLTKALQNNTVFSLHLPITTRDTHGKCHSKQGLALSEKGFCKLIKAEKECLIKISEAMLFDAKKLRQLGGLSSAYNSLYFALFDVIKKSHALGYQNDSLSYCRLENETHNPSFLLQNYYQKTLIKDAWVYQLSNYSSFRKKTLLALLILQSLFTLKPKHLWGLTETLITKASTLPTLKRSLTRPLPHVSDYNAEAHTQNTLHICLITTNKDAWLNESLPKEFQLQLHHALSFDTMKRYPLICLDLANSNWFTRLQVTCLKALWQKNDRKYCKINSLFELIQAGTVHFKKSAQLL